jgi:SAM-dependent methyltransferase
LNKLKINSIVEVGCGFGEILEHSDARLKVGYDLDDQVIKAARKISKNIIFKKGSLDDIEEDSFDCLLLFNWIHNLSEIELEKSLNKYYSKLNFLVLDQIQKDTKGYLYHHTFDFLNSNFNLIDTIVAEKDVRNILLYKKKD